MVRVGIIERPVSGRNDLDVAREKAERLVAGYVHYPVSDWSTIGPEERSALVSAAASGWEDRPGHQCYWNDRFCVATMCQLSFHRQQLAAWCLVSNGIVGYWEWRTHAGYLMEDVLSSLALINLNRIDSDQRTEEEKQMGLRRQMFHPGYSRAPDVLLKKIALRFDLPTSYFCRGAVLSDRAEADRERFNKMYPYEKKPL